MVTGRGKTADIVTDNFSSVEYFTENKMPFIVITGMHV
jgi:hypothetical protein